MVLRLPLRVSKEGLYTHCLWMPSSQTGTWITRVAVQKTPSLSTGQMQVLSPRGPWIPVEITLRTSRFCFWCMVASHTSDISWAELIIHPSLSALGSDAWCWLHVAYFHNGWWKLRGVNLNLESEFVSASLVWSTVMSASVMPVCVRAVWGQRPPCSVGASPPVHSYPTPFLHEKRGLGGSSPAFPLVLVC